MQGILHSESRARDEGIRTSRSRGWASRADPVTGILWFFGAVKEVSSKCSALWFSITGHFTNYSLFFIVCNLINDRNRVLSTFTVILWKRHSIGEEAKELVANHTVNTWRPLSIVLTKHLRLHMLLREELHLDHSSGSPRHSTGICWALVRAPWYMIAPWWECRHEKITWLGQH